MDSSVLGNTIDVGPDEFPLYEEEPKEELVVTDIPQGTGSNLDSDTVDGFQASRSGPNKLIVSDSDGLIPTSAGAVRSSMTVYSAVATTATAIPFDDTIPQSTEGGEFMTINFTPSSSTSTLVVEAHAFGSGTGSGNDGPAIMALFLDSETGARAATISATNFGGAASPLSSLNLGYKMTSGTTSQMTFKIRIGHPIAATFTFNGHASGRMFGGVASSWIKVTEINLI